MFKKYKNQDLDVAFWWKKNPKTPSDYVKLINDQLNKIETTTSLNSTGNASSSSVSDSKKKAQDEVSKYLAGMKHYILGEVDPKPSPEAIDEFYQAMLASDIFHNLIAHIADLDFESRKEVMLILSICLNYSKDNKFVTVDYLVSQSRTLSLMLRTMGLTLQRRDTYDIFIIVGNMIIECNKYEQLCQIFLSDPQVWSLFDFAGLSNFEISTQSMQILNSMLTTHPKLVAREFFSLEKNISKFIRYVNKLMAHGSYVTKRQSSKLLASLIVVRAHNTLMLTYINSPENLKLIMTLMTDKSKNLQLEAFNIFKVMVANPKKSKPVFDILVKNRDKLLNYFEVFGKDVQDSTFLDEKEFIVREIENLPRLKQNTMEGMPVVSTSPTRNIIGLDQVSAPHQSGTEN
ncbi:Protein HYM1 [Nakaseomyces bracarensis]|uniref:Protein HYM1 n=1 Tax=Nakaseomyces bracarensis TaxID=273131 RepID=A0ABR4NNI3_9SACH